MGAQAAVSQRPRQGPAAEAARSPVSVYIAGKIGLALALLGVSAVIALRDPAGAYAPRLAFYIVGLAFVVWGASAAALRRPTDLVRFGWFQLVFDAVLITALVAMTNGVQGPLTVLYFINIIAAPFLLPTSGVIAILVLDAVGFGLVAWGGYLGHLPWLLDTHRSLAYEDLALHLFGMALVATLSVNLTRAMKGLLDQEVRQGQVLAAERAMLLGELVAGTVEVDPDGQIRSANDVMARWVPAPVGRPLSEVLPGTGSTWEVVVDAAGAPLHLLCSRHPRGDGGALVLAQDVTRLRQMEAMVARDERLAAVGKLAAGMAHEIRNPLASLSGAIQLLAEDRADPLHEIALREVRRLDQLVEEFLDAARPPRLDLRPTDLGALVHEVEQAFRNDPRYRGRVGVELDLDDTVGPFPLDAARFRQVLWNLLLNAAQATPDQGQIAVIMRRRADHVELRVTDSGVGISPENMVRIFDPFFTTRSGGTGLGLANVERIMRAHGGSVSVYSKPGQGTSFMLCLPLLGQEVEWSRGAIARLDSGAEEVIEVDG
ncbi:ATP-binding protein [Myxococcota bacterium]|nr:ATP-binding protein [Myxococcota bacterium]